MRGPIVNQGCRGVGSDSRLPQIILGFALVSLMTAAAVFFGKLEPKYLVALLAVPILAGWMAMGRSGRHLDFAVAVLALSIPFNLEIFLLYRPHVGGAPGISISAGTLAIIALVGLLMYERLRTPAPRRLVADRIIFPAVLFFVVAGVLSLVNAAHPELVFFQLVRLLILVAAFLAVANLPSPRHINILLFFLALGVLIQSGLALVQYQTQSSLGLGLFGEMEVVKQDIGYVFTRATGTIGHPNVLAYFFQILIPIVFALALQGPRLRHRVWYLLVLAGALLGIFTTLSRAAWITLPVSLGLVFLLVFVRPPWSRLKAMGLLAMTFALVLVAIAAFPVVEKRFTHSDFQSAQSRMPLNQAAWSLIEQYPVTGVGLNNFAEVFKRYDTTGQSRLFKGYKQVVHNMYLLVWAELGTIGFIAFLWMLLAVFLAIRAALRTADPHWRPVLVGIGAGLLAHMIHGLADPGFVTTFNVALLVFILFGIVAAIRGGAGAPPRSPPQPVGNGGSR